MAQKSLYLDIFARIKTEKLSEGMKNVQAALQNIKPVTIKTMTDFGITDTMATKLKKEVDDVDGKIVSITKNFAVLKDGTEVVIGATAKWKDSTGAVSAELKEVKTQLTDAQKAIGVLDFRKETLTPEDEFKPVMQEFGAQEKAFDAIEKKATEWHARSQSMNKKDAEAIEKVVVKFRDLKKQYDDLIKVGDLQGAANLIPRLQETGEELDKVTTGTKRAASGLQAWSSKIGEAIKNTISYTFSLGLMRTAQQQLNQAIQYTIELNKEMVNVQLLQIEGAQTDEEIYSLAKSYNALAQQMGVTTLEVARGSVEWLRQGKTIEQTTELLKASTMLSKLGNLTAAEATEYLTSAINGYGMAAEDAVSIVDKLVAVDNVAATSTRELALALRYVSAVAAESGVSFEQLVSYIGTISQTTRQPAEMIGQALKTIFTRMQDIKAGKLDEDGLGINNTAIALQRVGIQLMESETEFRDLGAVLEDIAAKWDTLNEVEQANIAKAIAGVRQQNMFRILMQNMTEATRLQNVQMESAGLGLDRYGIYLESIEAKLANFKSALQSLYMEEGFQDLIKRAIDFGTTILKLVKDLGGLKTIFSVLIPVITLYLTNKTKLFIVTKILAGTIGQDLSKSIYVAIKALIMLGTQSNITAFAFKKLGIAVKSFFSTNLIGWIVLAAGAIFSLISNIKTASEKMEEANQKLKEYKDEISNLRDSVSTVYDLTKKYEELSKKINLTKEEEKELYDVQNKLKELFPELSGSVDIYGNFIISSSENMQKLIDKTLEEIEALKELEIAQLNASARTTGANLADLYNKMVEKQSLVALFPKNEQFQADFLAAQKAYQDEFERVLPLFRIMGEEAHKKFYEGMASVKLGYTLIDLFSGSVKKAEDDAKKYAEENAPTVAEALAAKTAAVIKEHPELNIPIPIKFTEENVQEGINNLFERAKTFADINKKIETNNINEIDPQKLTELGLELDFVNGKWILTEKSIEFYNKTTDSTIKAIETLIPGFGEWYKTLDPEKTEREAEELKNLQSQANAVGSAMQEQSTAQFITAETATKLANSGLGEYYEEINGKLIFHSDALKKDTLDSINALNTTGEFDGVLQNVTDGHFDAAIGALAQARAEAELAGKSTVAIDSMIAEINILRELSIARGGSGGGGGGSGISAEEALAQAEKDRINRRIADLEAEKGRLQERLDKFNQYIEAQKKSLELQKEEAEFQEKIKDKTKDLISLRQKIAELTLDTSREAIAQRLGLEDEAADIEEEIAQDNADRKYELEVQALDAAQKAFEDKINAQIKAIEKAIEKYQLELDAIEETKNELKGVAGAHTSVGAAANSATITVQGAIKQQKLDAETLASTVGGIGTQWHSVAENIFVASEQMAYFWKVYHDELETVDIASPDEIIAKLQKQIKRAKGCCFIAGTKVLMGDNKEKPIEDINIGDMVMGYDDKENFVPVMVEELARPIRNGIYTLYFENGKTLSLTNDHPLYTNTGWKAIDPIESKLIYITVDEIGKLTIGDGVLTTEGIYIPIIKISYSPITTQTYSFKVSKYERYFAERFLSHNMAATECKHQGGIVGDGNAVVSANGLLPNETFAKLLNGEVVANSNQINNFMKSTLPSLMGHGIPTSNVNAPSNVNLSMPINIEGNMDSAVMPDIERVANRVIGEMNKAILSRGYVRTANQTVS